jgi:hypothetical protein
MGHYFLNNKKEAIKFGQIGKGLTPDPGFKGYFDTLIADLNAGKEIFK